MPDVVEFDDEVPDISDIAGMIENPYYVHTQARCYSYQSMEHSGWEESWSGKFCQSIIDILGTEPDPMGVEDHPWGVE